VQREQVDVTGKNIVGHRNYVELYGKNIDGHRE